MQPVEEKIDRLFQKEAKPAPASIPQSQIPPSPVSQVKRQNKKLIFLILGAVVFLFIVGGAYYYYLEVFRPPQDAKQITELYEDIKLSEQLLGSHNVQDTLDYVTALDILGKREEYLLRIQDRLSDIKLKKNILPQSLSPRAHKTEDVLDNFNSMIELAIAANTMAKQKAVFLDDAYELLVALGRYGPRVQRAMESVLDPRQPRAVGAILADWETRTGKAKEIGADLFAKDPPQLNGVDSAKLKEAWEEAFGGFDDILGYLRAQDPNLTLSFPSGVPQPQTEQERQQFKGTEAVSQFIILFDSALNNNSAQDVLSYRFLSDESYKNLGDLGLAVEKQIAELEEFLPEEDRDNKLQILEPPSR